MKILILDNYDSFTYNLVHLLLEFEGIELSVVRNDKMKIEEAGKFDKILLSPGPGIPSEAGIMMDLIKEYAATKSILGVCLGHQGIGEAFGGKLKNLDKVMHGVATLTKVVDANEKLFEGMPTEFLTGRYHSWIVEKDTLPASLKVTAVDEKNMVMAMSHSKYDVKGVQFHPESILTEYGKKLIGNWIKS